MYIYGEFFITVANSGIGGVHMSKEKIASWIDEHREEIISEFKELIRLPSLTGEEKVGQDFIIEKMKDMGMEIDIWEPDIKELFDQFPELAQYPSSWQPELDLPLKFEDKCTYEQLMESEYRDTLTYTNRPNVVGTLPGSGGGKSLILNGHIDVVTVGDESKWKYPPFSATEEDGMIYGRGTTDMKSGVLAMVKAVEAIVASGVKLKGDVILQSVVNEEHSGNGSLSCIARGYKGDAALCAEPTGTTKACALSGGGIYWEIEVEGKEAHTGSRWKDGKAYGVSAIEKMAVIINALIEQESKINIEEKIVSLGIGTITGGTYATATAALCKITGVAYFSPALGVGVDGIQRIKGFFKEAVASAVAKDDWFTNHVPKVVYSHYDDAYQYPREFPFFDILKSSAKEALHQELEEVSFSACDARHLGNQGGIPTIIYGPGEIFRAHSVDECIDPEDIIKATKVMAMTILNWCQ